MAKINVNSMKKQNKERYSIQEEVEARYSVFEKEGERIFQIDTYGRSDRVEPEKSSQIIQLDEKSAKSLIKLLIEAFHILDE